MHQWSWVKRALVRKGVIRERRQAEQSKAAGFVPVKGRYALFVTTIVCTRRLCTSSRMT
jgi:hypothetical protein